MFENSVREMRDSSESDFNKDPALDNPESHQSPHTLQSVNLLEVHISVTRQEMV